MQVKDFTYDTNSTFVFYQPSLYMSFIAPFGRVHITVERLMKSACQFVSQSLPLHVKKLKNSKIYGKFIVGKSYAKIFRGTSVSFIALKWEEEVYMDMSLCLTCYIFC
jgi:hypothetical protein